MCLQQKENPKERCSKCKSIIIKGNVISGLMTVKCGNCGHINQVVKIKSPLISDRPLRMVSL